MVEECKRKAESVFGRKTREGTGVEHPKNTESSARLPRGRPGPAPGTATGRAGKVPGQRKIRCGRGAASAARARKKPPGRGGLGSGEYRIRTDDLLHAMQAL